MRAKLAAVAIVGLLAAWFAVPAESAMSVCLEQAQSAIAKDLGTKTRGVTNTAAHEASNGMPQCVYRTRRVSVTVNVDNGPQAGWRLMRKVVEATQIFGPPPPGWQAPIGLYGLGAYASWFPNLDALMANNHNRTELLTVTIVWPHAKRAAMIKLARAAIVPYIHASV